MKKTLLCLSMAALLSGCASSGTKIEQAQIDSLIKGKTTSNEVIALLGPPTAVTQNSDGSQVLGWGYAYVGFAGIGTEVESTTVTIAPDGTVSSYARSGSKVGGGAPSKYSAAPVQSAPGPMTKSQYKQVQLQKLTEQNLPYDEYQKRYQEIMAQ